MKEHNFYFKSSKDRKTNTSSVVLKGELSIRNASGILKKINGTKITGENVAIKVEDVDNMDITFIQLISSFSNTLKAQGREVTVESSLPEHTAKLIENSGLKGILNTK